MNADNTVTVTKYNGNAAEVTIPSTLGGHPVTAVGEMAFYNNTTLTAVTVPEGVTSIGESVFARCSNLKRVTLPASLTLSDTGAFGGCSALEEVCISDLNAWCGISFTSLDSNPLYEGGKLSVDSQSVEELKIPEGVTSVEPLAFCGFASLSTVSFPESLTSIGDYAFISCTGLEELTLPDGVTSIGNSAFFNCSGLKELTLPESLTSIGEHAFGECKGLTELTIPEGVTSIGGNAFYGCTGLEELTLPENLTSIGNSAFYECASLKELTLPEGLTSIGNSAFAGCSSLVEVSLPENLTSIGNFAFDECTSLTELTFPEGLTSIGSFAFYNCRELTKITIPNTVKEIKEFAFSNCGKLESIYFLGTAEQWAAVTTGTDWDSDGPENRKIYFLASITVSADPAAGGTVTGGTAEGEQLFTESERTVTATAAEGYRFINWTEGETEVSKSATYTFPVTGDRDLTAHFMKTWTVTVTADPADRGTAAGGNTYDDGSTVTLTATPGEDCLFVKWTEDGKEVSKDASYSFTASADRALTANFVPVFAFTVSQGKATITKYNGSDAEVTLPTELGGYPVTAVGQEAFAYNTALETLVVPEGVTEIGHFAFEGCSNLRSVTLPTTLTKSGYDAFAGCSAMDEVHISSLSAWCGVYFYNATANPCVANSSDPDKLYVSGGLVEDLAIPKGVDSIGKYAFAYCTDITEITIPSSVTSIGDHAFLGCMGLTEVTIPNTVTQMGSTAFSNCRNLTEATLGEGLTSIPSATFVNCVSLASVTIPSSVKSIGVGAFNSCSALEDIYYLGTEKQWNAIEKPESWNDRNPENQTVHFLAKITVSASPSSGGTAAGGTVSTERLFTGSQRTVTATPKEPYHFVNWTENGTVVSTEASYTFTVTGDRRLTASFKKLSYDLYQGGNGTWTKGSGTTYTATVKRSFNDKECFSHFVGVELDGRRLAANEYTAKAGSTVVTLNKNLLQNLTNGAHKLKFVFDDGTVETQLSIKPNPQSPATDDTRLTLLWAWLTGLSALGMGVAAIGGKKRRYVGKH